MRIQRLTRIFIFALIMLLPFGDTYASTETCGESCFQHPQEGGTSEVQSELDAISGNTPVCQMAPQVSVPRAGSIIFYTDFEANNGGLTSSLDWEWGSYLWIGSNCYNTSFVQPPAAYSGLHMWGTVLNNCYSDLGNNAGYSACSNTNPADDSILSFSVDLTNYSSAGLIWWEWYDLFSNFDWAEVYANGVPVFSHCEPTYTAPTAWQRQIVDLTPYTGGAVTIEFHMMASTVVNYAGWYIDDLKVIGIGGYLNYLPLILK